jgi:hypothetical protein
LVGAGHRRASLLTSKHSDASLLFCRAVDWLVGEAMHHTGVVWKDGGGPITTDADVDEVSSDLRPRTAGPERNLETSAAIAASHGFCFILCVKE